MKKYCITTLLIFTVACQTKNVVTLGNPQDSTKANIPSEELKLKWDKYSDDATLVGYRIYLKKNKSKKSKLLIDIKDPSATEVPLRYLGQINMDKHSYVYMTAYDQKNIESDASEAICVGRKCPSQKNDLKFK